MLVMERQHLQLSLLVCWWYLVGSLFWDFYDSIILSLFWVHFPVGHFIKSVGCHEVHLSQLFEHCLPVFCFVTVFLWTDSN